MKIVGSSVSITMQITGKQWWLPLCPGLPGAHIGWGEGVPNKMYDFYGTLNRKYPAVDAAD